MTNSTDIDNTQQIKHLEILGVGLVSLSLIETKDTFEVLLQKGIGVSLIQNIIELYKTEMLNKKNGKSFFPLEEFMVFLNYFQTSSDEIIIIIYIDEKESAHVYPKLYLHSKKIINQFNSNKDINFLIDICKQTVDIPRIGGVIGLFIVDYAGCPLYTRVMGIREDIREGEVQIGGFISALFSFSQFVIGKESGGKLREINFGNQSFYTITEKKVIIAYLIERMSPLLKRYMYIIAEEFVGRYKKSLERFDGDIAQFNGFEDIVYEYLII
ncbi:MAG: hypothetical protein JW891_06025 [Candidatus Lokiarchaeota archaeon]|nr:hypothetical protein [Candidatus Lokiarchaeota archaeon]